VACFRRFGSRVVYAATANAGVVQRSMFNICAGRTWIPGENHNWTYNYRLWLELPSGWSGVICPSSEKISQRLRPPRTTSAEIFLFSCLFRRLHSLEARRDENWGETKSTTSISKVGVNGLRGASDRIIV
jgi:hypothetical protein